MSDDANDVEEEASGGGSKILLILGLIIGIGIGGGVVYFMFGQNQQPPAEGEEKKEVEVKKAEVFEEMQFEKFAIPVFQTRNGRSYDAGNYVIDFTVASKKEHYSYVVGNRLALSQAFLSALNKYNVMKDGTTNVLDYEKAGRALTFAARKVVGKERVHRVFVTKAERIR